MLKQLRRFLCWFAFHDFSGGSKTKAGMKFSSDRKKVTDCRYCCAKQYEFQHPFDDGQYTTEGEFIVS